MKKAFIMATWNPGMQKNIMEMLLQNTGLSYPHFHLVKTVDGNMRRLILGRGILRGRALLDPVHIM
jgi:hypothetical protein